MHGNLKLINGMFDSREAEMMNCKIGAAPNFVNESQISTPSLTPTAIDNYSAEPYKTTKINRTRDQYRQSMIPNGKAFFKSGRTGKEELIGVSLSSRVNTNGHTIYDANWSDGYASSYVFWSNGHAEIFSKDGKGAKVRTPANFKRANDGSIQIISETGSATIFSSFNPATN